MPKYRIVNRSSHPDGPLQPNSLFATPAAVAGVRELAATLRLSVGALVDTAFRELLDTPVQDLPDLLHRHGHLTTQERQAVRAALGLDADTGPSGQP